MDVEVEDPALTNAQNWLRLICHVLTCNSPVCVLGERCAGGKDLLFHILSCPGPAACALPSCASVRRLALHWLRCRDDNCRLCLGVWLDLSGFLDRHGEQAHAQRPVSMTPPEQPGTPLREGPSQRSSMDGQDAPQLAARAADAAAAMAAAAAAADGPRFGGAAGAYAAMAVDEGEPRLAHPNADRAVVHLLEATAYLRYLLLTLMSRNTRDAPSSVPGRTFWFGVLAPVAQAPRPAFMHQQPPQGMAAHGAPVPDGAPAPGVLGPEPAAAAAAAAGAPARLSAGRRLLQHRLVCANSHCALCAGTCELFTRGQALRQEPALPAGLREMDDIVQELSLALNNINL